MYSNVYKFVMCAVIALCSMEAIDYIVNTVTPNSDIALMGMVFTILLLFERLYVIVFVESFIAQNK